MGKVELKRREVRNGTYPDLCVRCGAPADGRLEHTFRWAPWYRPAAAVVLGVVLVPLGALPGCRGVYRAVVEGLAAPPKVVLPVPLSAHWRWRARASWGGIILLGLLVAAAEAMFLVPNAPWRGARWFPGHGAFLAGAGAAFFAWLVALDMTSVRAAEITDAGLVLRGVSPAFIERLLQARRDARSAAAPAEGRPRYRVVAATAADPVVAEFDEEPKARDFAQFLRDSGSYSRVEVEEAPPDVPGTPGKPA